MSSRPVRLIYGYLSASSQPINIKLPWQQTTNDGMFAMNYSRLDAERDNLLFWAQTNWGDIPYKFKFGLDIVRYLFDPISVTKEHVLNNAKFQLSKYFGHLKVLDLRILTSSEDQSLAENAIRFYLRCQTKDQQEITINKIFEA
jgi:hypothetical protein